MAANIQEHIHFNYPCIRILHVLPFNARVAHKKYITQEHCSGTTAGTANTTCSTHTVYGVLLLNVFFYGSIKSVLQRDLRYKVKYSKRNNIGLHS